MRICALPPFRHTFAACGSACKTRLRGLVAALLAWSVVTADPAVVTTLLGNSATPVSVADGLGTSAKFKAPFGISADAAGSLALVVSGGGGVVRAPEI